MRSCLILLIFWNLLDLREFVAFQQIFWMLLNLSLNSFLGMLYFFNENILASRLPLSKHQFSYQFLFFLDFLFWVHNLIYLQSEWADYSISYSVLQLPASFFILLAASLHNLNYLPPLLSPPHLEGKDMSIEILFFIFISMPKLIKIVLCLNLVDYLSFL